MNTTGLILIGAGAYLFFNQRKTTTPVLPEGFRTSGTNRTQPLQQQTYMTWVQRSLNKLMGCGLQVDGQAGPLTSACVRRFQAMRQITVDGIVGKETDWEIHSALGEAGYIEMPNPYTQVWY